jgi:membrane protein implicated in regulation of membrane protease activity
MGAWLVWTAAAAALAAGEMLTLGFFLVPFALGAVVAAVLAAVGVSFWISLAALVVVALVLLLAVRPRLLARWRVPVGIRTGVGARVASRAIVVERIAYPHPGAVSLDGEVWPARARGEDEVLEPGTVVDVIETQGATVLVKARERRRVAALAASGERETP